MAWPAGGIAQRHEATAIVRGVRNATDFDAEYQLAQINRGLCGQPDTIFLPAAILPLVREIRKEEK